MEINKLKILLIYEILGRPPEHIKESLEALIKSIGSNPGIKVIEEKIHEPHLIDEEKMEQLDQKVDELYSTFAEVELEVDDLSIVFALVLNTLPSSIEIIEPTELKLKNFDLSTVLSQLAVKLHQYDEVTKGLVLERNQLIKIIKEIQEKTGLEMVKFEDPAQNAGSGPEVSEEKKKEEKIEDLVGGSEEDAEGDESKEKKDEKSGKEKDK